MKDKNENFEQLDYTENLIEMLGRIRIHTSFVSEYKIIDDKEHNEYCVLSDEASRSIGDPYKGDKRIVHFSKDLNEKCMHDFQWYDEANGNDIDNFMYAYNAIWQDIYNYNRSIPFPDDVVDNLLNSNMSKAGYRIVDMLDDCILCVSRSSWNTASLCNYSLWEYDRNNSQCSFIDAYSSGFDNYSAARCGLVKAANERSAKLCDDIIYNQGQGGGRS